MSRTGVVDGNVRIRILLIAGLLPAGLAGQSRIADAARELRSYVQTFVGRDATACGEHRLKQAADSWREPSTATLAAAVNCVVTAEKAHRAAWMFGEKTSIDSWVAIGVLASTTGELFRFDFDGSPCGGPGCPGSFRIERCARPAVRKPTADDAREIVCY